MTLAQQLQFHPSSVLYVGNGAHSAPDLTAHTNDVTHIAGPEAVTMQLDRRFDAVVIGDDVLERMDDGHRRAVMHAAIQHVDRGGHLAVLHQPGVAALGDGFWASDLNLVGTYPLGDATMTLYRRGGRTTVHDLLFEARATISRVLPKQLADRMESSDPPLVLDTRTHTDRERFGVIPGSIHVPRTVVEWHFDPANGYLHPAMTSFDQALVLVCNGGYSSSLAAANLVRLGFTDVADLIGGHTAWAAAGLPVSRPDHSHLDIPAFESER